ncbi:MAG: (d)CMP kinase [Syntrophobacteraceae bacterium]|jgi:cytidylate kinase|nr:(d)CMP kinase [Syntrophobacteraceae bacterium]
MIVAVDGPAGAGKSTVCRLLARELGYTFLDTGAMYRAVAWALRRQFPDGTEAESIRQAPLDESFPLRFDIQDADLRIFFSGAPLGDEIREPEITRLASSVSQLAWVRSYLVGWQRRLSADGRVVAEGRDTTTVVFPEAEVKVFLTADLATRARRRFQEYLAKGISVEYTTLESQIRERDEADSKRPISPLRPAPDARVIDTSRLEISQVVLILVDIVRSRERADPPRIEAGP